MKKIISYKFRIMNVQDRIVKKFYEFSNASNDVWNLYVEHNKKELEEGRTFVSGYTFSTLLTKLKKEEDYKYLNTFPARMLGAIPSKGEEAFTKDKGKTKHVIDTDKYIKNKETNKKEENPNYFKLKKNIGLNKKAKQKKDNDPNYDPTIFDLKGFPKIKSVENGDEPAFSMDKQMFVMDLENSRVWLTGIDGKKGGKVENRPNCWVSFRQHREVVGNPDNITIKKEGKYWYISIQCSLEVPDPIHPTNVEVGVDMGVAKFVACSDGKEFPSAEELAIIDKRLAKLNKKKKFIQRRLAKHVIGSRRYNDLLQRLNNLEKHICRIRMNLIHNVSADLSDEYGTIYIEKLQLGNMTASAKGNNKQHGKNVKAKAGLNRSILNRGCGYLKQQLKYKTEWKGGTLVEVNPKYTSQKCSVCGFTSPDNRKTQKNFVCLECGHTENADMNAAKNILAEGQSVTARAKSKNLGNTEPVL